MERLRIAICGGGLASTCLAHGLSSKHPDIEIKIFEGSPVLRDEGAAVGIGSNAQEALRLISPSLREALDEAGGTPMDPSVRLMLATGPESGRHIGDIKPSVPQIVVHRGSFLRALHKRIPENMLQMGKKMSKIELVSESGPIRLHFEDGTQYEADALVGCDGINSMTRQAILGADHPAVAPVYTNGYVHRIVVPLAAAEEALGKDYCSMRTQYGWIGNGGFLLTDFVDQGTSMQIIAGWSDRGPWPHSSPFVEWSKDRLRDDLSDWGDIGKAMTKLFTSEATLYAAGGRTHLDTPTYCKGPICIAGDAAQSFPPFQGAGAGQAIEDALMLSTVLGECSNNADLTRAFTVYDEIRRPRRLNIAQSSKWAAMLFTGRDPDAGLNPERIAEKLVGWGSNIYEYDIAAAQTQAIQRMRQ